MDMESYLYEFVPITPIFIGSGNELFPYNYIVKNKIYYKIDPAEIYENLSSNEQENFQKEIEKGTIPFRSYLNRIYKEELGYLYKGEVSKNFEEIYTTKLKGAKKPNEENQLIVKEFIESYQGKYIPGSSIKGAIRTAYLSESDLFGEIYYKLSRRKSIKTAPFILLGQDGQPEKNKEVKKRAQDLEAKLLHMKTWKVQEDPFKYLIVSDAMPLEEELIKVSEVKRTTKDNTKQDVPMGNIEALKSLMSCGVEKEFELRISYIKNFKEKEVFEYLNKKAQKTLENDIEFYRASGYVKAEKISRELKKMLEKIMNDSKNKEALIRLGQGIGFNSTTFNLYNRGRNPKTDEPKTRVVVDNCPMGWAIIRRKGVKK
jgi:CRISPR-associated protein Csm5